jgi:hypothetical protein
VQTLLSSWRDEARQVVNSALQRLPAALEQHHLEAKLAEELAHPLDALLAGLDRDTDPARVAALPERARRLVYELGTAVQREVAKHVPQPNAGEPQPPPPRELQRLRFSDVTMVRRIRTEPEWEAVITKLDEQVRNLLKNNVEVELD